MGKIVATQKQALKDTKGEEEAEKKRIAEEVDKALQVRMAEIEKEER